MALAAATSPEEEMKVSSSGATAASDAWYSVDEAKLERVRREKEWMGDPLYFKRVMVSPVACVKMLSHAHQGCEEGLRSGGKPLEVMGMLLGCPHTQHKDVLVVTDVFPLPVTGFETRVVADDESVINYMIELSELVEKSRKERLFGWYHSHPFDVDEAKNHCFLSSTDISTQLAWQNAEDPNGNPFLAIVIDPLRSFAKNRAEIGAFRAYPPTYSPPPHLSPDGSSSRDEPRNVELWGSCWNRYYELKIEYFMSSQAKIITDVLNNSFLWARTLGGVPPTLDPENRNRLAERVSSKVTDKLLATTPNSASSDSPPSQGGGSQRHLIVAQPTSPALPGPSLPGAAGPQNPASASKHHSRPPPPNTTTTTTTTTNDQTVLAKAANAAAGLAKEELYGQIVQATKRTLLAPNPAPLPPH